EEGDLHLGRARIPFVDLELSDDPLLLLLGERHSGHLLQLVGGTKARPPSASSRVAERWEPYAPVTEGRGNLAPPAVPCQAAGRCGRPAARGAATAAGQAARRARDA